MEQKCVLKNVMQKIVVASLPQLFDSVLVVARCHDS